MDRPYNYALSKKIRLESFTTIVFSKLDFIGIGNSSNYFLNVITVSFTTRAAGSLLKWFPNNRSLKNSSETEPS